MQGIILHKEAWQSSAAITFVLYKCQHTELVGFSQIKTFFKLETTYKNLKWADNVRPSDGNDARQSALKDIPAVSPTALPEDSRFVICFYYAGELQQNHTREGPPASL